MSNEKRTGLIFIFQLDHDSASVDVRRRASFSLIQHLGVSRFHNFHTSIYIPGATHRPPLLQSCAQIGIEQSRPVQPLSHVQMFGRVQLPLNLHSCSHNGIEQSLPLHPSAH